MSHVTMMCIFDELVLGEKKGNYHGKLEAAKRKTKSSVLDRPSICTKSSVFILLLPSCSLLMKIVLMT